MFRFRLVSWFLLDYQESGVTKRTPVHTHRRIHTVSRSFRSFDREGTVISLGICGQCYYFRRIKPPSQLLAAVFSTAISEVTQALNKIVEDENKQRDAEAIYKKGQASADKDQWAMQPVMTEFCGFRESDGEFLICEVKNAGGECTDFKPGKPERKACVDCTHCVTPDGRARDRKRDEAYAKMSISATIVHASTSQPDSMLAQHRQGVTARKAFEVSGIYSAGGVLASKPNYASYCAMFSSEDEYVICALRNPHSTCSAWTAATPVNASVRASDT